MILVLDCDGVVVLGHPDGGRWDKNLQRDLGLKPELLQERFFREHFASIVIGESDLFEVLDKVWPELECAATPREFVDYWLASDSRLDPQVLATVDRWRAGDSKAFLATVQEHHRARYLWDTLKLSEHFDGMLYSADLGARKPHAEFFERALARLPVSSPGEILFLDDFARNVEAARAQGWQAHLHTCADDLSRAIAALPSAAGI